MRGSKDWRSVGGGGDGVDGVGGEGGAGGERGAGDGGVGVGDGGGGGVGGGGPSTLRVWKDGTPCLATVVTFRLPEAGGGEGWSWRGRGGSGGTLVAASPMQGKPGGEQPADCGGPLLEHHGGGGDAQVPRKLKETQMEGQQWLESQV